jgi:hypothetical protein
VWRGRIDPAEFAFEIERVGRFYNNALVGVESNRGGAATLATLRQEGYPAIYAMPTHLRRPKSRTKSQKDLEDAGVQMMAPQFGWYTNPKTKPLMMNSMKHNLNHYTTRINDPITLAEMRKFAFLTDDAPSTLHGLGAPTGSHDDCVMAYAVALQVASQMVVELGGKERSPFREKTVEDLVWDTRRKAEDIDSLGQFDERVEDYYSL